MTESLDAVLEEVNKELKGSGSDVSARAPVFDNLTPARVATGKSLDHLYGVRLDAEAY